MVFGMVLGLIDAVNAMQVNISIAYMIVYMAIIIV
mgnify:CR=1 FL=1